MVPKAFMYGPPELTVEQINTSTGTITYLHHDQQGSTRLLTGSTGTVTGKCTYGAYGTPTCEGSATTPLGYDGQYTSTDTGLIYMRARVYDPATAQFLSVDPLVGQTHAPYNYAGDNPLNEADPTGLGNWLNLGLPSPGEVVESLNPVKYYEEEIESYENGCGYFSSVAHGLEGAVVGALDVSGEGEEAGLADGADEAGDELAATPEGRPYSAHYLNDTGPVRNIPGSVVDETITQATDSTNLGDRTVYYDAKNDVTVVQSNTTGKIMSVRKGEP
jgi:RHS repeat-associated protein